MPGKLSITPLPPYKDAADIPQMVVAINDTFASVKEAFDVLGMCFGYKVTVTVSSASTDTTVAHNLGVVPDGYAVVSSSLPCRVWKGDAAWTASNIYIQADKAISLDLLVFVDTN
jgi:hypothetical protein